MTVRSTISPRWRRLTSSATEVADPRYFKGGDCPKSWKCRYSDSAFADREDGVAADLGSIARTTGPGSLIIDGSFNIVGEAPGNAAEETILSKVGRTTGWTQGEVINSCMDVGVIGGGNKLLICQDRVAAGSDGGDSGSPVFGPLDASNNVTLYGILWGGAIDGSTFTYSPISNVEMELGALTTFVGAVTPVTDIAITAVSGPASVTQGDTTSVDVTVRNVGNQDVSSNITVTLVSDNATPDDDTDDITVGQQAIAGGLAAGVSTTPSFSWDTTDANAGDHTLTATHNVTDDDATNNSGSTVVAANEPGAGTVAHVETTTPITQVRGRSGKVKLLLTVDIDNASRDSVSNATVDLTLTLPGGTTTSASGTTGSDGKVTFELTGSDAPRGGYTSQVTNISGTNISFDQCTDADDTMDESKTTFTVNSDGTVTKTGVVDECAAG